MLQIAYLGVDIGTSSSKGVLVADDGTILRSAARSHDVSRPAPGHVEMDAQIWWQEFCEITEELTAPGDIEVKAIGVSGMGPCVLLTDTQGTPLRPAILYGVDTRATEQINELNAQFGSEQILATGGSVLSSQAVGPKIAWIRQNEPHIYERAKRLFMPASWLAFKLTGQYVLDHHSASQSTPMYDSQTLAWHQEWAPGVAPGLDLPRLQWPMERSGVTQEALAGIPAGTPVITGTIDAWSEALSVDAQNTGDLMLMYGTTMFLIATVAEPITCESMWGTIGTYEGTRSLAGGMATSGAITSWLRDLTDADFPTLLAEAETSGVGAQGLLALPYFAGERTPIFDPDARGVIAGLTLSHTRGDLYRAVLEATAFGVRHNIETMREAGAVIDRVVAVGGGTQGALWTQIVSDVTGLAQVIPSQAIGASYGAAILAAQLEHDVDVGAWNPPSHVVEPSPEATAAYDELFVLFRDLYPASRDITHALAARQRTQPPATEDEG